MENRVGAGESTAEMSYYSSNKITSTGRIQQLVVSTAGSGRGAKAPRSNMCSGRTSSIELYAASYFLVL